MNVLDPLNDELKKKQQHQFPCYMMNKLRSLEVKMDLLILMVLNLLYRNIVGGSNDQFQKHSHQLLELIVLLEFYWSKTF